MKFLVVCICAMVAASSAGKVNKKRGIFGSPEADAMNNYVVEQHGFNEEQSQYNSNNFGSSSPSDFHPSPLESSFRVSSYSSEPQLNYNGASVQTSSHVSFPPNDQYDHQGANVGYSQDQSSSVPAAPAFNAAPVQNYVAPRQNLEIPHESVQTRHSESIERGRFPVQVPRTIVKTNYVEHPVPQPYEVVKHVPQPYPVQRVRVAVKEVPVAQPYYVNKEVVRQVPVERLIHKPVPVVKYVHVPVEHQVPVYIQNPEPVYHAPVVHHAVAHQELVAHGPLSAGYSLPQAYDLSHSSYGLPQTYGAAHSYGSYGSIAHAQIAQAPLAVAPQGW